ncbi:hypothetical protein [Halomonas stenophila]|uniref:Uncharacterized protein n=1 Tax=Halomonas stenophila TaxID=795312 RepID=A0A7W5EVJ1_9GAMM|nr:hypothetical protein [Halomonas stenophila]MBB3232247.1 hypothetical protein [Halomonas stenophila]
MASYFEDILESYRPAEKTTSVDTPWSDPIIEATAQDLPFSDAGAPASAEGETAPLAYPEIPDADHFPEHLQTSPAPAEDPVQRPVAEPFQPAEKIVERETRIIENLADMPPPPEPGDDTPWQVPAPDVHLQEHVDRSTTHLHEHLRIVEDSVDFEPDQDDAGTPAPPDRCPAPEPAEPTEHGPDPALAEIEAELARALARLHDEYEPQKPFVSPDDFEPETRDDPIPPDIESVREVTREVVTEIHHHHTTESRVEPPATPAPRTAAEASRIGPIRFASAWKTGEP